MQSMTPAAILNANFVGVDDFRRELSDILEHLPEEKRELVITQHGKPKAILLDLNTYLQLTDIHESIIQPGYVDSLYKELDMVIKGKGITHNDLLKQLGS